MFKIAEVCLFPEVGEVVGRSDGIGLHEVVVVVFFGVGVSLEAEPDCPLVKKQSVLHVVVLI